MEQCQPHAHTAALGSASCSFRSFSFTATHRLISAASLSYLPSLARFQPLPRAPGYYCSIQHVLLHIHLLCTYRPTHILDPNLFIFFSFFFCLLLDEAVRHDTPRVVTHPDRSRRHGVVRHRAAVSAAPRLPRRPDPLALGSSPLLGKRRRALDAVEGDGTKGALAFNTYLLPNREEGMENRSRLVRPKPCFGLLRYYFGFSFSCVAVATLAADNSVGLVGAA